MAVRHYFNEFDPHAAAWLRELIAAEHLPPGDVDTRSIKDVTPDDVRGYTQCHFFAGIGLWWPALQLAGWPDDREVWTGSCPCQPFSAAGKRKGQADERHLWPDFFRLIDACRPDCVFGEQVPQAVRHGWWDDLCDDVEAIGYTAWPCDLPACCIGSPTIRQRLFWAASRIPQPESSRGWGHAGIVDGATGPPRLAQERRADGEVITSGSSDGGLSGTHCERCGEAGLRCRCEVDGRREPTGGLSEWKRVMFQSECDPDGDGWCQVRDIDPNECDCIGPTQDACEYREENGVLYGRMVQSCGERLSGFSGDGTHWREPRRLNPKQARPTSKTSRFSVDACDWLDFADGKTRPIEPGLECLVDGVAFRLADGRTSREGQNRAGILKGIGNAIVYELGAAFIEAFLETTGENQ